MPASIGRRWAAALAMVALASCGGARPAGQSAAPLASAGSLVPGWNRIPGGPRTTCALGSPYAFFVEVGDPRKLMIYFQGGGACWDAATCDPRGKTHNYKPAVGQQEQPYRTGILDPTNPENPTRGYTKVFVPYCTADLHLGARAVAFDVPAMPPDSAHLFEIHFNGVANTMAALDWVYAHVPSPQTIFVTGESAGSVPTPVYAAAVSKHYPHARVVQLGDASGSYESAAGITTSWRGLPALRALNVLPAIDSASLTYSALYGLAARSSQRISFAQINSADDSTQTYFLRLADRSSPAVPILLARNFAEIKRALPTFRSYTIPGVRHTIIWRREFYTTSVDGIKLRDWVDALINGVPPCSSGAPPATPLSCVGDVGTSLLLAR